MPIKLFLSEDGWGKPQLMDTLTFTLGLTCKIDGFSSVSLWSNQWTAGLLIPSEPSSSFSLVQLWQRFMIC